MTLAIQQLISVDDYLAGEINSEIKHEFIEGEVYAMAGASRNHDRLAGNVYAKLHAHLENQPCEPFSSDLKIRVAHNFFYPDAMVVCDETNLQEYYTDSPIIVVEVLSKSTRQTDQTLKRHAYQSLPSLQEYMLIEQDFVDVEISRRSNHWQPEHHYLDDDIYLASIDCHIAVETLYQRVQNEDMQAFLAQKAAKEAEHQISEV